MAENRIKQLLCEIELLLHWSNESELLSDRYRPVIVYKIRLIGRYRAELEVE